MSSKKYPSKYSNGKTIAPAQYITEIICEKKARIDKKDLHYRFWINPEWERFYKDQIATSYKLLKKYSDTAIIRGLNSNRAAKIYSLRAPHLPAIIEEEQKKLDAENQSLSLDLKRSDNVAFGNNIKTKRSIISKLKDLE